MNNPIVVSFRETAPGAYRVTYDGVVKGDSRGYSRAAARAEAVRIVNDAKARAERDGTPSTHIYRPGF